MITATKPTVLAGWTLESIVGSGASGHVLRVRRGEQVAAMKIAGEALEVDASALFAKEARQLAWSRSPTLPRLLDAGRLPGDVRLADGRARARAPYLVMTLAEGHPLARWPTAEPELAHALAWAVARDVALALADLHAASVSHGDVKPANIVVTQHAGRFRCTLVDLGLSGEARREHAAGGSSRYLAPESFDGGSDGRARDLYALGICLLECALPAARTAREPASLVAELDGPLGFVVKALLDPNPAARPSAEWVGAQCPSDEDETRSRLARLGRVEREYLLERRSELGLVERGHQLRIKLAGPAGDWLREQARLLERIRAVSAVPGTHDVHELGSLSEHQQRTWLMRLVGVTTIDFPALPNLDDDALARRLLALCERMAPEGITFADLTRSREPSPPETGEPSAIEVAVGLGSEAPSEAVLQGLERLLARGPVDPTLVLRGARALKRRNQLARALRVCAFAEGSAARLERANVLLRAQDERSALAELEAAEREASTPAQSADCAAQRARVELSKGNVEGAERALERSTETLSVLEARASVALSAGRHREAQHWLERALSHPHDAEQRARIEALFANLAQLQGDSAAALSRFRSAAEHATRAHAILEEATYLIGVASNAIHLGRIDVAIDASRRSELLFAHLGRPAAAARAALSSAAAYSTAGASLEATAACERTLRLARAAEDSACRAYAHLILSDLAEPPRSQEHLTAAERLLAPMNDDDTLRVAARRLRHGTVEDAASLDERSRAVAIDVQLEWWTARAEAALGRGRTSDARVVVERLTALSHHRAAPDALGPAMAFGAELAAELGDGDAARRFVQVGSEAWRRLSAGTPEGLSLSLSRRRWVDLLRAPRESHFAPEQVGSLATLIHGLSERDHLKALCNRVLDALVLWTGVERGLLLLKAPGGKLVPRAARNIARRDLNPLQVELSRSLAARALAEKECVVAADAQGELGDLYRSVHALELRSVMAVPLLARGEALGVVYLDDRVRRGAFGPRELSWVKLLAAIASVAILDSRDQLELRRAARRATRAERRLAEALAARDAELELAKRELANTRAERRYTYPGIIGESPAIQAMLSLVDRVTPSEVPVLICGESGSGKELVARALWHNGPRSGRPFVSENCSAIPETLLESTLFGHVKGAFTGASKNRVGLFEAADGGTLFLDEIADMSLGMQAKLLRALESGEIRRVGDERTVRVDVRVIGATHKNLSALVRDGKFREDLLYRLNVITINVPPLRERVDDIGPLVAHFLEKYGNPRIELARPALELLRGFAWPGNVRQLENETRRAMVLCNGEIRAEHLSPEVQVSRPEPLGDGLNLRRHIDALEMRLVQRALSQTEGNQTQASRLLGVSRFGLQKMMRRLGIEPGEVGRSFAGPGP